MKNTRRTPVADYKEKAGISQDLIKRIAVRLSEHQARQAAEPGDWGYVGDLGRVNEELAQVLASLGDRSGVEELGIRY